MRLWELRAGASSSALRPGRDTCLLTCVLRPETMRPSALPHAPTTPAWDSQGAVLLVLCRRIAIHILCRAQQRAVGSGIVTVTAGPNNPPLRGRKEPLCGETRAHCESASSASLNVAHQQSASDAGPRAHVPRLHSRHDWGPPAAQRCTPHTASGLLHCAQCLCSSFLAAS